MNNLFLVYFVNPYMFWAYLGPSSGGTTICIQQLVLIILVGDRLLSWLVPIQPYNRMYTTVGTYYSFRWMSVVPVGSKPTGTTDSHLKTKISTNYCIHMVAPPDGGPRYAQNM